MGFSSQATRLATTRSALLGMVLASASTATSTSTSGSRTQDRHSEKTVTQQVNKTVAVRYAQSSSQLPLPLH
eukprot:1541423-Rhodomonas_salina.2